MATFYRALLFLTFVHPSSSGAEKLSLDDANIAAFNSLLNSTESEETSANVSSILFRIEEYKRKDGSTNFDFLTTI